MPAASRPASTAGARAASRSTRLARIATAGLAREHRGELEVAQPEPALAPPVEHLEHADRAGVVDQRHGEDRARHVARALGRRAVEARVGGDVADGERLARREHVARDALARAANDRPDGARARPARGDADDEPVGVGVVERDRRGLGVEQRDRRVDDGAEHGLAGRRLEAAGDRRPGRDGLEGPQQTVVARLAHVPKS